MHKKPLLTAALLSAAVVPAVSMAELAGNVGWVSEYIFRGVYQSESSASAGLDFEEGGFYAGTWAADVGLGAEIDLYFGYSGSFGEGGGFTVGTTGYFYTEDNDPMFDADGEPTAAEPGFYDTITEINLGFSFGMFSIDHAIGEEDGWGSPTEYTFTSIAVSPEVGPYYSLNVFGDEYSGEYLEIGYGWELMEVDMSFAFLYAIDPDETDPEYVLLLSPGASYADTAFTFGLSNSFALGE